MFLDIDECCVIQFDDPLEKDHSEELDEKDDWQDQIFFMPPMTDDILGPFQQPQHQQQQQQSLFIVDSIFETIPDENQVQQNQPDPTRTKFSEQQKTTLQKSQSQAYNNNVSQNDQFQYHQKQNKEEQNRDSMFTSKHDNQFIESARFEYKIDHNQAQNSRADTPILDHAQFSQAEKKETNYEKIQSIRNYDEQLGTVFDVQIQNAKLLSLGITEIIDMKKIHTSPVLVYARPLKLSDCSDPRAFMSSPAPQGGMIQCKIIRDNSGMNHFHPKYELHLSNQVRFLMAAKKKANTNQSYYLISMHPQDTDRQSAFYLGKLRGVKSNAEFIMFDHGEDSKSKSLIRPLRNEIGAIIFEKGKSSRQPRDKIIILPKLGVPNMGNLLERYHRKDFSDLTIYRSNSAIWSEEYQSHVLNFHGRVTEGSIKNFQLSNPDDPDKQIQFQFGKITDKQFNLDFQYPLTPIQAFMIGLSSFEFKLHL